MTKNREDNLRHLRARRADLDRKIVAFKEEMDEITGLIDTIEQGRVQKPARMVLLVLHGGNDEVTSVHTFSARSVIRLDDIGLTDQRLVDCVDSMMLQRRHMFEDRYYRILMVEANRDPTKQDEVTLGYFTGENAHDRANAWATVYREQAMRSG
jgi:hypothetical protein